MSASSLPPRVGVLLAWSLSHGMACHAAETPPAEASDPRADPIVPIEHRIPPLRTDWPLRDATVVRGPPLPPRPVLRLRARAGDPVLASAAGEVVEVQAIQGAHPTTSIRVRASPDGELRYVGLGEAAVRPAQRVSRGALLGTLSEHGRGVLTLEASLDGQAIPPGLLLPRGEDTAGAGAGAGEGAR